jgi:hypothetical protein
MLGQLIENKPLPQWLASTQLSMLGDGLRNNIHNPGIVPSLLYSRLLFILWMWCLRNTAAHAYHPEG